MKRRIRALASLMLALVLAVSVTGTAFAAKTGSAKSTSVVVRDNTADPDVPSKTVVTYYSGSKDSKTSSGDLAYTVTYDRRYNIEEPYTDHVYWVLDETGTLYISINTYLHGTGCTGSPIDHDVSRHINGAAVNTVVFTDTHNEFTRNESVENAYGHVYLSNLPNLKTILADTTRIQLDYRVDDLGGLFAGNDMNQLNTIIMGTNLADDDLGLIQNYGYKFYGGVSAGSLTPYKVPNFIVLTDQRFLAEGAAANAISGMQLASTVVKSLAPSFNASVQRTLPVALGGKGQPAPVNHTGVIGHIGQSGSVQPEAPAVPPQPVQKTISDWAQPAVSKAILHQLVPEAKLRSNYTLPITRGEFAALAVSTYYATTGLTPAYGSAQFADGSNADMAILYQLGVIGGYNQAASQSQVTMGIHDKLTRAQAAVILARLADTIGMDLPAAAPSFQTGVSDWAKDSVGKVCGAGIMNGYNADNFGGSDPYTIQQAIVTMLRLYELRWQTPDIVPGGAPDTVTVPQLQEQSSTSQYAPA